jgi:proline iminopeptidase
MQRERRLASGPGRVRTRDGLSLWYTIAGRGPALLVPTPGWGASADMYIKSFAPLRRNFTLIFLDTRGSGRSDAPAKASGYRFAKFIDDLETLRRHLKLERWLILGHSAASSQALAYALKHRRRCRGLFIVCGTMNADDKELRADLRARMKKLEREPWFEAANSANPQTDAQFKTSFLRVQLPLYFASRAAAVRARPWFAASTYRIAGNVYDDHVPRFTAAMLARIKVPVAVFQGDCDVICTPLEALRIARAIPDATLGMVRNAGHFPWLEQRPAFFKDFADAAQLVLAARR